MGRKSVQPEITQRDLGRWKLLEEFRERLAIAQARSPLHPSFLDPRRQLEASHYLSLFLFGLLNPVVRTMRGLCQSSQLPRVQTSICGRPVSLGSFSEAQHLLEPALLQKVFEDVGQELHRNQPSGQSTSTCRWLIQDSTLWAALPRMHWALWRTQDTTQRAVRLHLSLHVFDDAPLRVRVTPGAYCERQAWKEGWQEGDAFIGDRNYSGDYRALRLLERRGCRFIVRLIDKAVLTPEEELSVTAEDRAQGVIRQAWVRLGCKPSYRSERVRLVWVQGQREVLMLVTNLSPEQMTAALVSQMYRCRWQIELFFRWIKCILGCRHWLAESPEGVAIQIYLALIAALLLQLATGRRPTKRMMELIQFYLLGVATLEDLEAGLEKESARLARQKRK